MTLDQLKLYSKYADLEKMRSRASFITDLRLAVWGDPEAVTKVVERFEQ